MPPRLGALAAVVFWGVSFVATKVVVEEVSPLALIFARAGLGALLLVGLQGLRRQPLLPDSREAWCWLGLMGFLGVALHLWLQAKALTLTTAVNTGWLIALIPIWSALLSAWLLKERFGALKAVGLAIGFLGATVVVTRGRLGPDVLGLPATRGDLLVLASTLTWALYSVLGQPVLRRLGPVRATQWALLLGWVMLAPLVVLSGAWRDYAGLSAGGWGAVLFLGLVCSGLGYLLWYGALARVEVSGVASLLYLEPLVTLAAAVLLLSEPVGAPTLLGGMLLLGGVHLVQRGQVVPLEGHR